MTSDFGSDIFDEAQRASTPSPKAEAAPAADKPAPPADGAPGAPDAAGQPEGSGESGNGSKRSRSRRKPREAKADGDTSAPAEEQAEPSGPPADAEKRDDGDSGSAEDGSRRGRRRGRRSRGGQARNRDDHSEEKPRRERGGRHNRDRGDSRRGSRRDDERSQRPALDLPIRQRVAIFLDASELQAQAGDREISFGHLRRHITNARVPIRAIAYHPAKQKELAKGLKHCGFEVSAVDSKANTNITMAIDAMSLAERVDCVILVPGTSPLAHLAKTLQARGIRVETASFEEAGEAKLGANEHLAVGAESCFVV